MQNGMTRGVDMIEAIGMLGGHEVSCEHAGMGANEVNIVHVGEGSTTELVHYKRGRHKVRLLSDVIRSLLSSEEKLKAVKNAHRKGRGRSCKSPHHPCRFSINYVRSIFYLVPGKREVWFWGFFGGF
ncbi:hypothetical protein V6N12_019488 [Hibiscus sabdariffa]|uniref:Uncharacterized protein n=1 Tax=Hibiscus sabdariffa TaxID=183260 RepID=A0ABR2BMF3_9ROSI